MKRNLCGTQWRCHHPVETCRGVLPFILALFMLVILLPHFAAEPDQQDSTFNEYEVKNAFLGKFCTFIEWPDGSEVNNQYSPYVLGVMGHSAFLHWLEKFYIDNTINGKPVKVRGIDDENEIDGCNVLFISSSLKYRLSKIIEAVQGKPILLVSDTEGFADKGVHINFYFRLDRPFFEVNEKSMHDSGLKASFHLMKMARIIDPIRDRRQ